MAQQTFWTTLRRSCALACTLAGCTDEQGGGPPQGPDIPSLPTFAVIDAAGGSLSLGAATLEIPPGALEMPVPISIRAEPAIDTDEYQFLSPLFELQPDGLTFAVPATLTIELPDDASEREGVYVSGWTAERGIEPLVTHEVPGGFAAELSHFSWYSLAFASSCSPSCEPFWGCCEVVRDEYACVPIDDNLHCGSCDPCTTPTICCDHETPLGRSFACIDVKANDDDHCGSCGTKCSENTQGRNHCCAGNCVDFDTDEANCGGCGKTCAGGDVCEGGVCVCATALCPDPQDPDAQPECCPPGTTCHAEPVTGGPCL